MNGGILENQVTHSLSRLIVTYAHINTSRNSLVERKMKDKNGHYSSFVLAVGERALLNYLLLLLFLSLSLPSLIASMSVRGLTQKAEEEEDERLGACRHPCLLTE